MKFKVLVADSVTALKAKSKELRDPMVESVKEILRIVLLAVIPVVIVSLENGDAISWKAIATVAMIAFLRGIDKLLHEYGKDTDNESIKSGLTRF